MKTQAGLVRWSPVAGANGYQVWYPEIGKSFSTHTNVADLREFFTFHRADSGWWSTAKWRVRAVRRVFGTIPNGLPAVSYGPWSPLYTAKTTSVGTGKLRVTAALSDRTSTARGSSAHELMPGLVFTGDTGLDGWQYGLFRTYASTDRDCVNVVFRGSVVGSPAFAPRTTGPLVLPSDPGPYTSAAPKSKVPPDGGSEGTTFGADWRPVVASETRGGTSTTTGGSSGGTTCRSERPCRRVRLAARLEGRSPRYRLPDHALLLDGRPRRDRLESRRDQDPGTGTSRPRRTPARQAGSRASARRATPS